MQGDAVEVARRLADEVLRPDAEAVDAADRVPRSHLEALDAAGLTGHSVSGAGLAERVDVTAALAGGCLATAFVWIQHQGALAAVARSAGPAARFAPALESGAVRAGVVVTAVRGPSPLRIDADRRLTGSAPWVTGWGVVDVLRVAAVDDSGDIRTVLVDVGPGMTAEPARLVAANASGTVTLTFEGVAVPADRDLDVVTADDWAAADAAGLALNGALPLGLAAEAARLIGSSSLGADVAAARDALLRAPVEELPAARAACAALALRAASALAVHDGGRGVLAGSRSDRLLREAHFLLAFGSRPAIKASLLSRLAPS
ncbi:acyl-CoA dehydrogenase family protein [Amnibacterium endophyticum]|uniref:Acyl-CoA dehydrogenase family protein n=1 Tax=Amnibacterium endophyticum TaxID=2109337 RepID=A0ABW4LI31_9MICO